MEAIAAEEPMQAAEEPVQAAEAPVQAAEGNDDAPDDSKEGEKDRSPDKAKLCQGNQGPFGPGQVWGIIGLHARTPLRISLRKPMAC